MLVIKVVYFESGPQLSAILLVDCKFLDEISTENAIRYEIIEYIYDLNT